MQILLDNAYESWRNALYYHDQIMKGIASLGNQKGFVSSLHNAIELFFKQIMLDENIRDASYCKDGEFESTTAKLASVYKDGRRMYPNLTSEYERASDLNAFFFSLSEDKLKCFRSIEFNHFIYIHDALLNQPDLRFKDDLELINSLRNKETHFYINPLDYLSENQFCQLHNFMVDLYPVLKQKNLMPIITESTSQGEIKFNIEQTISILRPPTKRIELFNYKEQLKNNPIIKGLMRGLDGSHICGEAGENDVSAIATSIVFKKPFDYSKFDEIYTYISLMKILGIIVVQTDGQLVESYNTESCETELSRTYIVHVVYD